MKQIVWMLGCFGALLWFTPPEIWLGFVAGVVFYTIYEALEHEENRTEPKHK